MALNPKQRRFAEEYLVDQHVTKAAIRAGYSKASAHSIGSDLLKKPEIKKLVEKGLKFELQKAKRRAARAGMTKERWLSEVRAVALANMDDYVQIEEVELGNGRVAITATPIETKLRPRRLGRAIKRVSEGKHGIGIELHSKQAALDTIGKHYGWLKNEVDLNLPDAGVQVIVTLPANGREAEKPAAVPESDEDE